MNTGDFKRYEVGDKVWIKGIDDLRKTDYINPSGKMDKWAEEVMTIDSTFDEMGYRDMYKMKEDNGRWCWYEDMFQGKVSSNAE